MANVLVDESSLSAIGNAIRGKLGVSTKYKPREMANAISSITGGGGTSKNVQVYSGTSTVKSTSYTATSVSITVAKSGTYNVSWMGYRNRNSGTNGSQLYINGSAYGSANTSFVNTYGQFVSLSNVSLSAGDVLVIRARSSNTSYVMGVGNLVIEEI